MLVQLSDSLITTARSASAFLDSTLICDHALALQDHAQDAVDAEPGMPEASVGVAHFPFGPRGFTVSGRQ